MSNKKLFLVSFKLNIQDYPDMRRVEKVSMMVNAISDVHARISILKHYDSESSMDTSYSVSGMEVTECLDIEITKEDEEKYNYL